MPIRGRQTLVPSLHSRLGNDEIPQDPSATLESPDVQSYAQAAAAAAAHYNLMSMDFSLLDVELDCSDLDLTSMSNTPESDVGHIPDQSAWASPVNALESAIESHCSDGSTTSNSHLASAFALAATHSVPHVTRDNASPDHGLASSAISAIKENSRAPTQGSGPESSSAWNYRDIYCESMDNHFPDFQVRSHEAQVDHQGVSSHAFSQQEWPRSMIPSTTAAPFVYPAVFTSHPLPLTNIHHQPTTSQGHPHDAPEHGRSGSRYPDMRFSGPSSKDHLIATHIAHKSPWESSITDNPFASNSAVGTSSARAKLQPAITGEDGPVRTQFQTWQLSSPGSQVHFQPSTPTEHSISPQPSVDSKRSQSATKSQGPRELRAPRTSQRKRVGGRKIGSSLTPAGAADAKMMRSKESCWPCVFLREKCTPGEICVRCLKRKPNTSLSSNRLGCFRTKVSDIGDSLIPTIISSTHKDSSLREFETRNIKAWTGRRSTVQLVCIQKLPVFEVVLEEFESATDEPLRKWQLVYNRQTRRREPVERPSPALGFRIKDKTEFGKLARMLKNYVENVVDNYFEEIAERKFSDEEDDFQTQLLLLLRRLSRDSTEESKCFRNIFRLIVVVYIHDHTIRMKDNNTSPRMANRQLKFQFHILLINYLNEILRRLQGNLHKSKAPERWVASFCSIIGVAIPLEDLQRTAHVNYESLVAEGKCSQWEAVKGGEHECRAVDDWFMYMVNIFREKYKGNFNPLRNCNDEKMDEVLGSTVMGFVRDLAALVTKKRDYLYQKQYVQVSVEAQEQYANRLVARFLFSFWGPSVQE